MKSINKLLKDYMNKKGQTVNLITASVVGVFVMVLIIIFLFFVISSLNPTSLFSAGSLEQNATTQLIRNTTSMGEQIGSKLPTIGLMLVVLLILAVFVLVILYLRRAQSSSAGKEGGSI